MTLAKYIKDLLFRYECVIVPEFGGFLTKTVSAAIDKKTNTLYPPSKKLAFNSQLLDNDGLLANYIASVDQVPYETAINYIDFEVKEWQQKLINEDLVLDEIGVFSLNVEGKIQFEPDTTTNFLTESFGLAPVIAPEIAREDLMNEEANFDLIFDEIANEDIVVNDSYNKKGIAFSSFLKYAAIFAILFTIGYFLTNLIMKNNANLKFVEEQEKEHNDMVNRRIQEATFEINKTLDPITLKIGAGIKDDSQTIMEAVTEENEEASNLAENEETDNQTEETIEVVTKEDATIADHTEAKINTPAVEETIINKQPAYSSEDYSSYKYHIIAGAFKEVANAEKKVRQLTNKGFKSSIVGVNKWQLNQVAFGSFQSKSEAKTFLQHIKKTEAKDAWLLTK